MFVAMMISRIRSNFFLFSQSTFCVATEEITGVRHPGFPLYSSATCVHSFPLEAEVRLQLTFYENLEKSSNLKAFYVPHFYKRDDGNNTYLKGLVGLSSVMFVQHVQLLDWTVLQKF